MTKIEKIELDNGETYTGELVNGKKHGKGTYTFSDGGEYVGDWKNDVRHGQGTETFPDGYKYTGEYKDDLKHGYGKIITADGTIYEGNLEEGLTHGQGKLTEPDGSFYEGSFVRGRKNGQGKEFFIREDKKFTIEGTWFDDFLFGDAVFKDEIGSSNMEFYYGKLVDKKENLNNALVDYPNENHYSGNIKNGLPEGLGKMYFKQGSFYDGNWKKGKAHGFGFLSQGGDVWEGEFNDWKPPKIPVRTYGRKSYRVEDPGPYIERENYPRVSEWIWMKKNSYLNKILKKEKYGIIIEHELEAGWTIETLKIRLKDGFRGAIDKYQIFTMSPLLEMSEEDFIKCFEEYCAENDRKGRFVESVHKTKSFVFDDTDKIKTGFSKFAEKYL